MYRQEKHSHDPDPDIPEGDNLTVYTYTHIDNLLSRDIKRY